MLLNVRLDYIIVASRYRHNSSNRQIKIYYQYLFLSSKQSLYNMRTKPVRRHSVSQYVYFHHIPHTEWHCGHNLVGCSVSLPSETQPVLTEFYDFMDYSTAHSQHSTTGWPLVVIRGQNVWPYVDCASMADRWHQLSGPAGNHWLWYHNNSHKENKTLKMYHSIRVS